MSTIKGRIGWFFSHLGKEKIKELYYTLKKDKIYNNIEKMYTVRYYNTINEVVSPTGRIIAYGMVFSTIFFAEIFKLFISFPIAFISVFLHKRTMAKYIELINVNK